jgi:hypothetical protein
MRFGVIGMPRVIDSQPVGGRGGSVQSSAMRVCKTEHSHSDGIYVGDFAGCPEKLPSHLSHGRT